MLLNKITLRRRVIKYDNLSGAVFEKLLILDMSGFVVNNT